MTQLLSKRFFALLIAFALSNVALSVVPAQEPELRYQWEADEQFTFEVDITVDTPTILESLKILTGKHKIEAFLLVIEDNLVKLHRTDGKELLVPPDPFSGQPQN